MQRRGPSSAVASSTPTSFSNNSSNDDGRANGNGSSSKIGREDEVKALTAIQATTASTSASSLSPPPDSATSENILAKFSNWAQTSCMLMKDRNRRSLIRYVTILLGAFALVSIGKTLKRKSQKLRSGKSIKPSKTSTLSSSMALTYSAAGDVGTKQDTHSRIRASFDLAYQQSFGFFDDIPNSSWILMQNRVKQSVNHLYPENPMKEQWLPWRWYQDNWEPTFACQHERRIGGTGMGDGPKWVCNPHRIVEMAEYRRKAQTTKKMKKKKDDDGSKSNSKCLIYSIGSNGDFQFEEGLHTLLGGVDNNAEELCEIHVFDPKDFSSEIPSDLVDIVQFHPWGVIGTEDDGSSDNFKSLPEIVNLLGHEERTVDIFKIDCEGCEWNTYVDWFESQLDIRQILVEVHNVPDNANDFFETIQDEGFVIFHKEPNTKYSGGMCQEYAFIKLHPEFFE